MPLGSPEYHWALPNTTGLSRIPLGSPEYHWALIEPMRSSFQSATFLGHERLAQAELPEQNVDPSQTNRAVTAIERGGGQAAHPQRAKSPDRHPRTVGFTFQHESSRPPPTCHCWSAVQKPSERLPTIRPPSIPRAAATCRSHASPAILFSLIGRKQNSREPALFTQPLEHPSTNARSI